MRTCNAGGKERGFKTRSGSPWNNPSPRLDSHPLLTGGKRLLPLCSRASLFSFSPSSTAYLRWPRRSEDRRDANRELFARAPVRFQCPHLRCYSCPWITLERLARTLLGFAYRPWNWKSFQPRGGVASTKRAIRSPADKGANGFGDSRRARISPGANSGLRGTIKILVVPFS